MRQKILKAWGAEIFGGLVGAMVGSTFEASGTGCIIGSFVGVVIHVMLAERVRRSDK